ncbi:SH3 domain-containing protein [Streptomyces sp. Q6]|uniref:SH3 domain-containing protein n=1 Tax=Streptomyces citrinus TaxID=3118173 RepID=A0ACD5A808_9ACTN
MEKSLIAPQVRRVVTALTLAAAVTGAGLVAAGSSEAAAKGCHVTAHAVSLRSKPSSRATSVGIAYKGNKCSEKDWGTNWTKVKMTSGNAKGRTGWIRNDLIHRAAEDIPLELH